MVTEDVYIEKQELEELLTHLHELRNRITENMKTQEKSLNFWNEKVDAKTNEIDDFSKKYRFNRFINFLSFLLAVLINGKINKQINTGIVETNKKYLLETLELLIYFIPFYSQASYELKNSSFKEELKYKKEELKEYRKFLKECKIKQKRLRNMLVSIEDLTIASYNRLADLANIIKTDETNFCR